MAAECCETNVSIEIHRLLPTCTTDMHTAVPAILENGRKWLIRTPRYSRIGFRRTDHVAMRKTRKQNYFRSARTIIRRDGRRKLGDSFMHIHAFKPIGIMQLKNR